MKVGTLKFKDRWGCIELYGICSAYLNNQTEEGALLFLRRAASYTEDYCEVKEAEV